jgi:hypothetical protein
VLVAGNIKLTDPGKTFTSAIVTFPPATRAVPHRRGDASVYAYEQLKVDDPHR